MYDVNIKNVKKGKQIYYIFFLFGFFFLVIMGWIYISSIVKLKSLDSSVISSNVEVKSYIDDEGKTMYSPVYYYVVDGVNYACGSASSSTSNPGTKNKNVYYNSKDPSNCMTEYSKSGNNIILLAMLIPIVFIVVAVININGINKRIKKIKKLNQNGKLIKNLPYRLENSGTIMNGVPIQIPVVDYTLPSGTTLTLSGDLRYDGKNCDADGMVDLLIDENDPNNYFIDFEINRLSGNLPQDYYQQNPVNVTSNQNENLNINDIDNSIKDTDGKTFEIEKEELNDKSEKE